MSEKSTYPLRFQTLGQTDAEKVAVLKTAEIFARRRGKADWEAFERLMNRPTNEPPVPGDELPEGYVRPSLKRPV